MRDHNILLPIPAPGMDLDHAAMTTDHRDERRPGRGAGVSLFRRGPAAPSPDRRAGQPQIRARDEASSPMLLPLVNSARVWSSLNPVTPDPDVMARNGLFPISTTGSAAVRFDLLRTQMLLALAERGWTRIGVTAPTRGCGASHVALNLALSFARRPEGRTVLVDLDLRAPVLARRLGLADMPPLRDYLADGQPIEAQFRRIGQTLALGLNGRAEPDPGPLLQSHAGALALDAIAAHLEPGLILFDLPALLEDDEVLALRDQLDAVLLVTDGTRTSPADLRAAARLLEGRLPLLAVILNRGEEAGRG